MRIIFLVKLYGPDAAAYFGEHFADCYHFAGGQLVERHPVMFAMSSRLRLPLGLYCPGLGFLFASPLPNFYPIFTVLSSVYFLSMPFSRSFVPLV